MNSEFYLWSRILVYLYQHKDDRITSLLICKHVGTTSAAVYLNIKMLIDKQLLLVNKEGRTNRYLLTTKGEKVAQYLEKVMELLR